MTSATQKTEKPSLPVAPEPSVRRLCGNLVICNQTTNPCVFIL